MNHYLLLYIIAFIEWHVRAQRFQFLSALLLRNLDQDRLTFGSRDFGAFLLCDFFRHCNGHSLFNISTILAGCVTTNSFLYWSINVLGYCVAFLNIGKSAFFLGNIPCNISACGGWFILAFFNWNCGWNFCGYLIARF